MSWMITLFSFRAKSDFFFEIIVLYLRRFSIICSSLSIIITIKRFSTCQRICNSAGGKVGREVLRRFGIYFINECVSFFCHYSFLIHDLDINRTKIYILWSFINTSYVILFYNSNVSFF